MSVVFAAKMTKARGVVGGMLRSAIGCLGLVVVLSGCKTDIAVRIRARAEGSGVISVNVVLDQEAAQWLGSADGVVAAKDLEARGWTVLPVSREERGGSTFGVQHAFSSIEEGNALLRDLSGANGPFGSLVIERQRSLLSTAIAVKGSVDLTQRLEAFGDDQLRAITGSQSKLGVEETDLLPSGDKIDDLLHLELQTDLGREIAKTPLPLGASTPVNQVAKVWTWEAAAGIGGVVFGLLSLLAIRRIARKS